MRTLIDGQATGDEQTSFGRPLAVRYEPGAVLSGKYRLEALLGEGGMGAVWRATNILLDLPVAIKLIRADLDRGALRARLHLEARAAAKLGHPAIVRVYDVGENELRDPFIVMEHLRGETLAKLISRGPVASTRAVQLLLPIIDALAMAHGRGIVHRDLKPDNLMIALEEQHVCPKILDFGIAKLTDPRDSDHKLTEIGAVVGSPEYMSPEQARGRDDIDASTDIWSICVVLYEAVTGCPPFSASNCNALLRSIVEDDPKPFSEHALADAELWRVVKRGLHKDRAQRYTKISELGRDLAAWLVAQGVTEDACGSSIDSQWLGRANDPQSLSHGAASARSNEQLPLRSAMDSHPDSTGIARGPFTKTIMPGASTRSTRLGMAAAGCALLAVSLLASGLAPRSGARAVGGPALSVALPTIATTLLLTPPASLDPPLTAPVSKTEVQTVSGVSSEPDVKPPAPAPRVTKPPASVPRTVASIATPVASSAPVAPKPERPLDLLAPY